jgi:NAD-dependent dihydropyrimidine dehydrogenase PreA subunit
MAKEETQMSDQEIYQAFVDWMDQFFTYPDAESRMAVTMATFSPEEALLMTGMSFQGRDLEELAEEKGIDPAELGPRLDAMAEKGLVFRTVKADTVRYSLNEAPFGIYRGTFWPGVDDQRSRAIAPSANQYYYEGTGPQMGDSDLKVLRTIPINMTMEDPRRVLPFESMAKMLDQHDYFAVSHCSCRVRKNLDPDYDDCKYSTENCMHFGRLGRYTVENGLGREITREEAEEIIRKAADEGLVHGASNYQEAPDTLCSCDPCCCIVFEAYHKLGHAEGMGRSNFLVSSNPETCAGCGRCVKRCPMYTIELVDQPEAKDRVIVVGDKTVKNKKGMVAVPKTEICIGCGVCVHKCPTHSLVLVQNEETAEPPKTRREFGEKVFMDIAAARARREKEAQT